MADNVTANAGSGGAVFATDHAAGVHHPYVKVEFGADNTQTPVSVADPLPVVQTGAWALITLGCQSHSQSSDISQQDELRNTHQGAALDVFQAEITFHPGKVALDIRARPDDRALSLLQEEQGGQFALASPPQIVVHSGVSAQPLILGRWGA